MIASLRNQRTPSGVGSGEKPNLPRSLLTVHGKRSAAMISKREAAQRLLARWLDEVASGKATMPLREFITAGQVDAVIAFDLLPDYSPACRARDFAALRAVNQAARGQAPLAPDRRSFFAALYLGHPGLHRRRSAEV